MSECKQLSGWRRYSICYVMYYAYISVYVKNVPEMYFTRGIKLYNPGMTVKKKKKMIEYGHVCFLDTAWVLNKENL